LKALAERSGFLRDFQTKTFAAQGEHDAPNRPTAWLSTGRVASA
jgi:hypothetical protein